MMTLKSKLTGFSVARRLSRLVPLGLVALGISGLAHRRVAGAFRRQGSLRVENVRQTGRRADYMGGGEWSAGVAQRVRESRDQGDVSRFRVGTGMENFPGRKQWRDVRGG